MALSAAQVTNGSYSQTTTSSSYVSASSITIGSGNTAYVIVSSARGAGAQAMNALSSPAFSGAALAISGASVTYDPIATPTQNLEIWKVTGTGSSGQVTVGFASNHTGICVKIIEITGDTGTVVQKGTGRADTTSAVSLVTDALEAFGSATNGVLVALAFDGTTQTVTWDSPMVEVGTKERMSDDSPTMVLSVAFYASQETTPTVTTSTARDWAFLALELQEDAGGGGSTPYVPMGVLI
jgi:hypothetical protein